MSRRPGLPAKIHSRRRSVTAGGWAPIPRHASAWSSRRWPRPTWPACTSPATPVTGADEIVVETTWGLGEAIVQGLVIPDRYLWVPKTYATR
jgi:hypothetical protein